MIMKTFYIWKVEIFNANNIRLCLYEWMTDQIGDDFIHEWMSLTFTIKNYDNNGLNSINACNA